MNVGDRDGLDVVGLTVGSSVGFVVGLFVGFVVGTSVGSLNNKHDKTLKKHKYT